MPASSCGKSLEHLGEHRDGEVEIAVLLHVEVDESTAGSGLGVQGLESFDDSVDGLVERPHRELAGDRGHLDGHIVDVVALEQLHRAVATADSLTLAEHSLAEEVDVQAVAALAQLLDRVAELGGPGVDDQVPDEPPQRATGLADDETRHEERHHCAELEQQALVIGQELRGAAGEGAEVPCGDLGVLGPHDPVDETDREVEAGGILQEVGESLRGGVGSAGGGSGGIDPSTDEFMLRSASGRSVMSRSRLVARLGEQPVTRTWRSRDRMSAPP